MEWVETTGRSIDEAKDAALDRLGVDETEAEFEVLDEPKFGLFGRLRSDARIRARVRPTTPRPKQDRRDRHRRRRGDSTETGVVPATTGADVDVAEPTRPYEGGTEELVTAADDLSTGRSGADRSRRSHHHSRSESGPRRGQGTSGGPDESADAVNAPRTGGRTDMGAQGRHEDARDGGAGMDVSLDEQGEVARQFLDGLADEMDLDAEVTVSRPDEDTVELHLEGNDLGLLIGAKGATLLALQDLTRTVVQRKTSAGNGRLLVDVSGYRAKRKEALERFTRQLAEEVSTTGLRKVLEPMNAADRKIVHDTVNELEGVTTTSEGEEPRRRVVILPTRP